MMVLSATRPDVSLGDFLATRARAASPRRLTLDVLAGAGVVAIAPWRSAPGSLLIAGLGACFLCYGAWGLLDRERARRGPDASTLAAGIIDALAALSVAGGIVAVCAVLLAVWGAALGTWIS